MNNLSRRTFLGTAAASAALPRQSAARKRPNFVFFMPDEMRAESLAAMAIPW